MKSMYLDEKQLRRIMVERDIKSITELSLKSGVSKPTIYEYINGKSPISDAFVRLCKSLDISPFDILIEVDDKEDN